MQEDRYKAPALDKGLDIIELLSDTDEGLSLAEIAKALDRTSNEIYRMIDRLVRRRYVVRTSADRYELSLKLFGLAHRHPPMRRLVSLALPEMRRFSREAGQSCHLVVYDRGSGVVIAQMDSPSYWGLAIRVGTHISLLNTGSGHVLLAFASPAERRLMLEERAPMPDETWPERFEEVLAEVRERGYEMRASQQTAGVTNLSAPILVGGETGASLAVLTCPHLARLDGPAAPPAEFILTGLLGAAHAIAVAAGFTETPPDRDPGRRGTSRVPGRDG